MVMDVMASPPSRKVKWLGPLKPLPPTAARTVTAPSADVSADSTASVTCLPMNSASLQERIAAGPVKVRPQSSTLPVEPNSAEERLDVAGVRGVDRRLHRPRELLGHERTIYSGRAAVVTGPGWPQRA